MISFSNVVASRDQRDTMLTLTHAARSSCGATAKMNDILDNVWTVFQRKTIAGESLIWRNFLRVVDFGGNFFYEQDVCSCGVVSRHSNAFNSKLHLLSFKTSFFFFFMHIRFIAKNFWKGTFLWRDKPQVFANNREQNKTGFPVYPWELTTWVVNKLPILSHL